MLSTGIVLSCIAFCVVAVPIEREMVLDDDFINAINEKELGWKAARNSRFEGVSLNEAKRLLGVRIPEVGVSCTHNMDRTIKKENSPAAFDARVQWPDYIHPIRNQAQCGSCWAFAASEVLSDRFAIASNGTVNNVLSAQELVSCDPNDMGCEGGWPQYAADFLVKNGIPTDSCVPYTSSAGSVAPCPSSCSDGSQATYYKYESWEYCTGEAAMMAAVSTYGPVAVSMAVYSDFFSYNSGVYSWDGASGLAGYHAVKLVGYGADYWIVANSWGTSWGEDGYFRIAKGSDMCGIENGALDRACPLAGVPLL